jgi:hypothetical protein
MFKLNNQPLALDAPFTAEIDVETLISAVYEPHSETGELQIVEPEKTVMVKDLVQFPANWLRNASQEEREALGITEVEDPQRADDRFYWDGDVSNPKDLDTLKIQWVSQSKQTAGSMLAQSDWMVIRKVERNVSIPADIVSFRAAVVSYANDLEAEINAAKSVEDFVSVVTSQQWPSNEPVIVETPEVATKA